VAEVTSLLLQQLGYKVHATADANAALQALDQRHFDLVVSDIVMAGPMDGLGLARVIRGQHPKLPIILVTGYSRAAGQAAEEFTLLRKPYQLADMSRAVAKCVVDAHGPQSNNIVQFRDAVRHVPLNPEQP
jgi:CheY-like chemotaxis protein